MGQNYPRLGVEAFGKHLLRSNDLDPIYVALRHLLDTQWGHTRVKRWLVAYWCFYHAGFACYASGSMPSKFWDVMNLAAENLKSAPPGGRWPRGSERRHARGGQGIKMVEHLESTYRTPEMMVDTILDGPRDFASVRKRVKTHYLFGDWIAFKVGDMLERVLHEHVDFSEADVFMFKDPVKGAELVWDSWGWDAELDIPEVVLQLKREFKEFKAPPDYNRPIGLQEVETILCKWKSHLNGHYPLNNDITEIREGLEGWGTAADTFLSFMPEELTYED